VVDRTEGRLAAADRGAELAPHLSTTRHSPEERPEKMNAPEADVLGTSAEAEQRPVQRERFIGDHGGNAGAEEGVQRSWSGAGMEPQG
jgi:hypothetical protein